MINGLQILTNLPLFKVEFPDLAGMMVGQMLTIATFDIMPSDKVLENTLAPPEDELDPDKYSNLVEAGFESDNMIVNLGTMFLVFAFMLTVPCCLICIRPCRRMSSWLDKNYKSTATSMYGNVWIRYAMEGCIDIAICAVLNLKIRMLDSEDGLRWDTTFYCLNNAALFVLLFAVAAFPIWALWFYCKNFDKWEDETFEERYGAAYEGLKKDRRATLAYPLIFMLRRFALVLTVIQFKEHLFL